MPESPHGPLIYVGRDLHHYPIWAEDERGVLRDATAYVPKDTLGTAIVAGVEVAGQVRDANQAERRRLKTEVERLREALAWLCAEIDEAVESVDINRAAEARNHVRATALQQQQEGGC